MEPEKLREIADHPDLRVAPALEDALALVADGSDEDAVFITGSLFLVGEARSLLGAKR